MGLGQFIVGRTGYCIHPFEYVKSIPKIGGTKNVNLAKIRRLKPSHVLVNVDENRLETVVALRQFVPHVVVTHPMKPADNLQLIDQIVDAIFSSEFKAINVEYAALNALKNKIATKLLEIENREIKSKQKVLYLIWRDPWMTVARDTYISQMLALIGWETWPTLMGGDGLSTPGASRYPVVSAEASWLKQVDRVLLSSEPYQFNGTHLDEVQQWMPHAKVQLVDGEMLSWYGSRAVAGLDYVSDLAAQSD